MDSIDEIVYAGGTRLAVSCDMLPMLAALIWLLAVASFSNSILTMDWVFDDYFAVVENTDLREAAPVKHNTAPHCFTLRFFVKN